MIASESSRYQQIAVLFADWSSVQSIIIKKEKKIQRKFKKKIILFEWFMSHALFSVLYQNMMWIRNFQISRWMWMRLGWFEDNLVKTVYRLGCFNVNWLSGCCDKMRFPHKSATSNWRIHFLTHIHSNKWLGTRARTCSSTIWLYECDVDG